MVRLNARAVRTYFLMTSDSTIHPRQFIPNHVTGIYFDNKVDYAIWFSAEKYCIHGIQMIPVSPINGLARSATFIKEEWDDILSQEMIVKSNNVTNAWLSLLLVNKAVIDQADALAKLATATMDDGLTCSWALYNAASRGSPTSSTNVVKVSPTKKKAKLVALTTTNAKTAHPTETSSVEDTNAPMTSTTFKTLSPDVTALSPVPDTEVDGSVAATPASLPPSSVDMVTPGLTATTKSSEVAAATEMPSTGLQYPGWMPLPPGWTSNPPGWTSISPGWTSYTPGVVEPEYSLTVEAASTNS
uniref:glucan endo-1,3-beta-D-glucosidase n=1 Tax=Hyaloperonospora arabidopsidis (strain Emoy2) TaxID=559515 RepID=M4B6U7_HYAAE